MKHKLWTRNAELELKIIRINLETDRDSTGLKNFETMKRLAFAEGYTPEEELAVWNLHFGKTDEALLGRRAARNEGLVGEAYFRSLFQSVRGHAE